MLSIQTLLDLREYETKLIAELRAKNTGLLKEANAIYWMAEQVSKLRMDFYTKLIGGGVAGLKIAFAGSSSYEKYVTDGTYEAVPTAVKTSNGVDLADIGTKGRGLLSYAKVIAARTGMPVQYLMVGRGGTTTINDWLPATSSNRRDLVNGIKAMGGVDLVNWACDFNDLFQNIVVDGPTTLANIRSFIAAVRAETGLPNLKFTVGVAQRYDGGNPVAPDAKWSAVRAAEMSVAGDPGVFFGTHWFDFPQLDDRIHMTDASYTPHAIRLAENSLAALGLGGAVVERGPKIASAYALYSTQTAVVLTHSGGNDFGPTTGITGFEVSFNGGASWVAATASRIDANTVRLTHPDSAGAAPMVQAYQGRAPNVAVVLKDNSPRQLPLNPSINPVQAPTGSTATAPVTPPSAGAKTLKVAFSNTSATPPADWNAFRSDGSQTANINTGRSISILDTAGAASGWAITARTGYNGGADANGQTTANDDGVYPNSVMKAYIYNGTPANGDNGGVATPTTTMVLTVPAADRGKPISIDLFASRSAADRPTTYTAGGVSQTLDAGMNTSKIVTFSGLVSDANGEIIFTFAPAAGYTYGYLGALVVRVPAN